MQKTFIRKALRRAVLGVLGIGLVATAVPTPVGASGSEEVVPAPTYSIGDAVVAEGGPGLRTVKIPITLSAPLEFAGLFTFRTLENELGAQAGTDYRAVTRRVKIAAGKTTKTVAVPIIGDSVPEVPEAFLFELTPLDAPPIAALKDQGLVRILDDDDKPAGPQVTVESMRVYEGDSGKPNRRLLFAISDPQATDVFVTWRTVATTATPGVDFSHVGTRTTRIRAGHLRAGALVAIFGDTDSEADEAFYIEITAISGGSGVGIGPILGPVVIADDDEDSDGDLLSDIGEMFYKTDPEDPDSDDDGLTDGMEVRVTFTNPNQADTDHDGFDDLEEVKSGTDPNDPSSHP